VSTTSATAQNHSPTRSVATSHATLPTFCLVQTHSSKNISVLLESVQDHPTAGAYNTLGALYAQADRVTCAVASFELSLKLENQNWEAHYNLGLALIRKGDRMRASKELQTAIQQKPDLVSAHFALGSLFQSENKLTKAEKEFRSTLAIDPHFIAGAVSLSQVLLAEGKPQGAITSLEETIKQTPADQQETLQSALGLAYAESGDSDHALSTLKDVVASHPSSAEAHFNLGQILARTATPGDEESAATEFAEALRLDPTMDAGRLALARVLISLHSYSDAAPVALEYNRRQPGDAQGFYVLGLAYKGRDRTRDAIRALQHAAMLNPRDAGIRFDLASLLAGQGKAGEAIQQLHAAEQINPSDPEIYKELASLLTKTGHEDEARAERAKLAALTAIHENQSAAASLTEKANQYLTAGDAKAAIANYRKALQLNPHDAKLHYNLSLALDEAGDLAAERKELERAFQSDPSLAVAQNQWGLLALRQGQRAEAEQHFKKALELDPAFAEALSSLGVLYSQQGKNQEAASLFQQAIENDPKFTKAYVNLGLLMAQSGRFSEAEQQFRIAIQVDSNYADSYSALGMLQAKTGRGPESLKNFEKVVVLQPDSAQAHLNLGIALVDQFDRAAGFREFSQAVRLDPKFSAAHCNLGRFYFETGKYADADRELELAIHLNAQLPEAFYFLALTAKQENQLERSTGLLQKLIALQPDNADGQYLLGQNMEHSGDMTGAIQHWKLAVNADPNHSQALFNLAKFLNKTNDPGAKQYQDRFDALQKSRQITDRVSELGNFALEAANAQNWPQAFQQMNEAIQLCGDCPENAHLHKNLGLFYERTGNIGAAQKELGTALRLTPNDTDVQNALAMMERAQQAQVK